MPATEEELRGEKPPEVTAVSNLAVFHIELCLASEYLSEQ